MARSNTVKDSVHILIAESQHFSWKAKDDKFSSIFKEFSENRFLWEKRCPKLSEENTRFKSLPSVDSEGLHNIDCIEMPD